MSQFGGYKCQEFEEYCQREARKRKAAKWVGGGIIAILIGLVLLLSGCRTHQPTVIEKEKIVYVHSDSTIFKDSTVIIPIERYVDIVPQYDTLLLSTSLAISKSWLDTTNHILRGNIKNLKAVEYKYIEVERVVYNDSIVEKEVPVPYEVEVIKTRIPWWSWVCLCWALLCLVYVGFKIYLKIAARP